MFRPGRPTKQFSCAMKPFSAFGADVRKQPTAIRLPTKRRGRRHGTGDSQCGPSASSSPSPSSWLVPRWRVLRIRACRASALSPIVGRRLRIRHPSRWSWQQSKRSGSFRRKSPIKAPHVCTHLFRSYPGVLASRRFGRRPKCRFRCRRPRSAPCSRFPIHAASSCGCARPIWSDAGRIPKPFAAVCTITRPRPSKMPICAKPCCAASARPACRRSSPPGCRRPSNPRSARPSPRSPSQRCSACSSRRRTS